MKSEERSGLKRRAARAVKWNALTRVATSGLQLLTAAILARFLAPADFGLFSLALVGIGFLQELSDGGLANAIIRDRSLSAAVLRSVFWFNLFLGACLATLAVTAALSLAPLFGEPALVEVACACALVFVVGAPGNFFSWVLRRELQFRTLSAIELVSVVVWMTAASLLALAGQGVMAMVWSYLLRAATRTTLAAVLAPEWRRIVVRPIMPRALFAQRDLVRFASFQMLDRLVYFVSRNIDFAMIGALLGATALGYYAVAYNLVLAIVRLINPSLTDVSFSALSQVKEDAGALKSGYVRLLALLSAVVFPILVGCALLGPQLLAVVYGERWREAAPVFQALSLFGIFYSVRAATAGVLQVKGRADVSLAFNAVSVVAISVATFVGATVAGIRGVSVALVLVSFAVLLPLDLWFRKSYTQVNLREFAGALGPTAGATAVMALAVAAFVAATPTLAPLAQLILGAGCGALVYLAALWLVARPFVREIGRLIHLSVAPRYAES
jgi:O-antigen/teichoic acid export membrane protein